VESQIKRQKGREIAAPLFRRKAIFLTEINSDLSAEEGCLTFLTEVFSLPE